MAGANPAFVGTTKLVQIYRGGVGGAWEVKGLKKGYLISKLMREWSQEGGMPNITPPLLQTYKVPLLLETVSKIFEKETVTEVVMPEGPYQGKTLIIPAIPKAFFQAGDASARKAHAVSSSKSTSGTMPTGNSAYVSLTFDLQKATEFTSDMLWRFDICDSDLFPGNAIEKEELALGGTPIYNISVSMNRGVTFTETFGNGDHGAFK